MRLERWVYDSFSTKLRDNKLAALAADMPTEIVTTNSGCLTHLQGSTRLPVRRWIELIDERLG